MKKSIAISSALLLVVFFLGSCRQDDHIILSKIAYRASFKDSTLTADQREALRLLAEKDSVDLAYYLKNNGNKTKTSSYSPSHGHGNVSPTMASVFPVNNTLAAAAARGKVVDVCLCPGGTSTCPCPESVSTNTYFTTTSETREVKDDTEVLVEERVEGEVEAGWKAYKLTDISDRIFTLTITADFAGIGMKTYTISMEIKDGKLYTLK